MSFNKPGLTETIGEQLSQPLKMWSWWPRSPKRPDSKATCLAIPRATVNVYWVWLVILKVMLIWLSKSLVWRQKVVSSSVNLWKYESDGLVHPKTPDSKAFCLAIPRATINVYWVWLVIMKVMICLSTSLVWQKLMVSSSVNLWKCEIGGLVHPKTPDSKATCLAIPRATVNGYWVWLVILKSILQTEMLA
jgi:hypothetical protein